MSDKRDWSLELEEVKASIQLAINKARALEENDGDELFSEIYAQRQKKWNLINRYGKSEMDIKTNNPQG